MTRPADVLVLSGGPGLSDPWHPFERTSAAIGELLEADGSRVDITHAGAGRLGDLTGVDLLVVNAPVPETPLEADVVADATRGLEAFLSAGGAVLAVHVGVTALLGLPGWSSIVGARWVPERSGHPPLGSAAVSRRADPRTGPAGTFRLVDERYCDLDVADDLAVVVEHEHDGRVFPLVWTREVGRARIVADALGHGTESFESPEHRAILSRLAAWAVEPRTAPVDSPRNVSLDARKVASRNTRD